LNTTAVYQLIIIRLTDRLIDR